jgi:hypothetical protein
LLSRTKLLKVRWFNYGIGELDGTLVNHPDEVWYRLSLDAKVRLSAHWCRIPATTAVSVGTMETHCTQTWAPCPWRGTDFGRQLHVVSRAIGLGSEEGVKYDGGDRGVVRGS